MSPHDKPHALALLSGGLDSILAARLVQEQGVAVRCLHFVSPFFGKPHLVPRWEKLYGLRITTVDIAEEFAKLLADRPSHGFGSALNPCVDCKILMLRHARRILEETGACCVLSGEVLGQRPMSQRRDAMNVVRRDAGLKGKLLRPLCALHMEETEAEAAGLIDRQRLLCFSGRGRKDQLALAERFRLPEIPTPGGGCRLTEKGNARSYWPVLKYAPAPGAADFFLANTGRQFWHATDAPPAYWLLVGRNEKDNARLADLAGPRDLAFTTVDFPGPLALG
ncbi:MAG: tRNA(5-methylaminomethyl-2-thiouridylate) methyltransferase, partial [Deltaproteobacteria bacterium]|nr:tRNA(5-methylaminomethyl-2-thiouridylate) methyltransferase [Deltaproteobacteria bacterium]